MKGSINFHVLDNIVPQFWPTQHANRVKTPYINSLPVLTVQFCKHHAYKHLHASLLQMINAMQHNFSSRLSNSLRNQMNSHPRVTERHPWALFILPFQSALHDGSFSPEKVLKTHHRHFRLTILTYSILNRERFSGESETFLIPKPKHLCDSFRSLFVPKSVTAHTGWNGTIA